MYRYLYVYIIYRYMMYILYKFLPDDGEREGERESKVPVIKNALN